MTTGGRNLGGNLLLWAGLAMIALSLLLALAGNVYAWRLDGDSGAWHGPMRQGFQPGGNQDPARGRPAADVGSIADAREAAEEALQGYGNPDLEVAEVMEFANNYYAEVREKDTGIGAMELLVDKTTGQVYPEPGPNMMWNTKYGMMSGRGNMGPMMGSGGRGMMGGQSFQQDPGSDTETEMAVSPERAVEIANDYLGRVSPGTEAAEAERFYGYYTLHTEKDGEITGMLSVNGYSGEVWYHSWHGPFVAMEEAEE
jgi:hypothetical protein